MNWRTLASALEVSALQIQTLVSPSLGNLRSRAAFDCSEGWKKLFVCTAEVAKIWTEALPRFPPHGCALVPLVGTVGLLAF